MFQGLKDWYNDPYTEKMTVTRWFLFVGLILLLLAIWKVVIAHLMDV